MSLSNKWLLAAEEGLHEVDYVCYGTSHMPSVAYYACANPQDWSCN